MSPRRKDLSAAVLDRMTDHGVRADEMVCVLPDIFERLNDKAAVFSQ